ncbi:MAG: CAP domain-containing protein [Rhizobiaceae bacterium]|nr:CAP domain-containing protein [Rhizobiaceae bacterium]
MTLDIHSHHDTPIDPARRRIVFTGSMFLLAGTALLQGCARGSSSHGVGGQGNKRRQIPKETPTPLRFDVADGFRKLNAIRRSHYLPEFNQDRRLQKAAQDYANLMGSRGLYGHEIGPGTDFKSRIFAVGYNNSSGENIGVGYGSVDAALEGWLGSRGHRKNMMKRGYTLAGLAYGFNTSGRNPRFTHYWVLIMGKADKAYM